MNEVLKNTRTILFLLTVTICTSTPAGAATWDTTVPDYGSSAYERRNEQGKYYEGNEQYPYSNRSNVDRYNDYARERDQQEQARRNSQQDNRRTEPQDLRQDNRRNSCRSLYGAC